MYETIGVEHVRVLPVSRTGVYFIVINDNARAF